MRLVRLGKEGTQQLRKALLELNVPRDLRHELGDLAVEPSPRPLRCVLRELRVRVEKDVLGDEHQRLRALAGGRACERVDARGLLLRGAAMPREPEGTGVGGARLRHVLEDGAAPAAVA